MTQPSKAIALKRLKELLDEVPELKRLSPQTPKFEKWHRDVQVALRKAFGQRSEQVGEFVAIPFSSSVPWDAVTSYIDGLSRAEAKIQSMIEEISMYLSDQEVDAKGDHVPPNNRKVFIVHGRDAGSKAEVARFLQKLDFEPIILAEMPSGGKTIIEKVEEYSEVGYAVVLLTKDDEGALVGEQLKLRARQNVIFELGFFVGKLLRGRVCALTKGGPPEILSDYAGVEYVPMEDNWEKRLMQELRKAGFDVDANKAL